MTVLVLAGGMPLSVRGAVSLAAVVLARGVLPAVLMVLSAAGVGLALDRAAARLLLRNPALGSVVVAHVAVVHPSPLPSGQEFLPQMEQPGQLERPLHLLLPLRL